MALQRRFAQLHRACAPRGVRVNAAAAELPRGGGGPVLRPAYLGPDHLEARLTEQRAREAGLTPNRARVVANIASFRDGWMTRRTLAEHTGLSIRTVQRSITQYKEAGHLQTARSKPGEIPPGATKPFWCGFSHRWIVGRGQAGAAMLAAVTAAKLKALARKAARPPKAQRRRKTWQLTDEQRQQLEAIDADSRAREQPPPE